MNNLLYANNIPGIYFNIIVLLFETLMDRKHAGPQGLLKHVIYIYDTMLLRNYLRLVEFKYFYFITRISTFSEGSADCKSWSYYLVKK